MMAAPWLRPNKSMKMKNLLQTIPFGLRDLTVVSVSYATETANVKSKSIIIPKPLKHPSIFAANAINPIIVTFGTPNTVAVVIVKISLNVPFASIYPWSNPFTMVVLWLLLMDLMPLLPLHPIKNNGTKNANKLNEPLPKNKN